VYRHYNIIASGHHVRKIQMCRVESFLNNRNKLGGVVLKVLKRLLRNNKEVGESWERDLRPGRLTNEIFCVGDGDQNEGTPHVTVGRP
jgi:hypothetical protein